MEPVIVVGLWLFAIANIDTFVVLIAFFTDVRYELPELLLGHYLGFTIGLVVAIGITLIATELLNTAGFLLGIIPLGMGLWGFFRREVAEDTVHPPELLGRVSRLGIVAGTGIGLSGENIVLFVPFFVSLTPTELALISILYLIAAGLLFGLAHVVANRTSLTPLPDWIERRIVPATLILVGTYVLITGWIAVG